MAGSDGPPAGALADYVRRASAIDPRFHGPDDVSQALATGADYTPRTLAAGVVALGADAAAQEPKLRAGLRRVAADPRAREALARRIEASPEAALDLPGGAAAAARARAAIRREAAALTVAGSKVRAAAYDVQASAWSRAPVQEPQARLQRIKSVSAVGAPDRSPPPPRAIVAAGPAVTRAVAVAALRELGRRPSPALMEEPRSAQCLRLAKLNLFQCLASAGPNYEDIYCLGRHALAETGQCVASSAGGPA